MKKSILLLICMLTASCYAMSPEQKEILAILKTLFDKNPLALCDLQYCIKNPDEPVHPDYKYLLKNLGLLNQNYEIKPDVRTVVENNMDGEWLEIYFKESTEE